MIRWLICCSIALPLAVAVPAESAPTVGAIRWDGWFKDNTWEKNLADAQWRYRLPFYATVSPDGAVRVCGDTQETMDREIAYAKAGGLSYWAFCYYHPKSWKEAESYNYGWRRYLASEHKEDLNFCLLLQGGSHIGPPDEWEATVREWVGLFQEPTYQRVCGGRPLLYVFSCENLVSHFGSVAAAAQAIEKLREASKNAGVGDPYIVAQIWPHQVKADFVSGIAFDALSAYSAPGSGNSGESYAKLLESNLWYWETFKATGRQVIPLVNAGWDGRPRAYPGVWYEQATPAEVAGAVKRAFDWIRENPAAAPSNTVLVYAWNEHDEGGWLCPTIDEGAARLDAIEKMLETYMR